MIFNINNNVFHHMAKSQICSGAGFYFRSSKPHSGTLLTLIALFNTHYTVFVDIYVIYLLNVQCSREGIALMEQQKFGDGRHIQIIKYNSVANAWICLFGVIDLNFKCRIRRGQRRMTFECRTLQSLGITAHHCGIEMLPPECESVTFYRATSAKVPQS